MEKRYEEILLKLEAEKGIYFEIPNETNNELVIKAHINHKQYCMENCSNSPMQSTESNGFTFLSTDISASRNYANPPIPPKYRYIRGKWNHGFVIERLRDESQFVWVPVGFLEPNGTIDDVSFNQQFGRRTFGKNIQFGKYEYEEKLSSKQQESVERYGGFYLSRFNISQNARTGRYESKRGQVPCIVTFREALRIADYFECSTSPKVSSHLTFGAEYDSTLEWLIESKVKTLKEIANYSFDWGNFSCNEHNTGAIITGSSESFCTNEIYDLSGNVKEWTQETYCSGTNYSSIIKRGGSYKSSSNAAYREKCGVNELAGFRIALYLEP